MASSLLQSLTPSIDTDPRESLRNMQLRSKRLRLSNWFAEHGYQLRDASVEDLYDISVRRKFTLVAGDGLDLAILEIPGWILDDGRYARDLDAVRHGFRGKTVRFVARELDLPCPAVRRVFRDWKLRDEIDATLAPWRYLVDWENGDARLDEVFELPQLRSPVAPTPTPDTPGTASSVFISYSHNDRRWKKHLDVHLAALKDHVRAWSDEEIPTGADWSPEISTALRQATVAVLLVSPDFLASKFIRERELPFILDRVNRGEMHLVWVLLSSCHYEQSQLNAKQAAHDLSKPLDNLSRADRNRALKEISGKLLGILEP